MPQFIPLAIGIGGQAVSALGKSKAKNTQTQDQTREFNEQQSQEFDQTQGSAQEFDNITEYSEDPFFSLFRKQMASGLKSQMAKANKPVYGDAQKAGFLNELNDLAEGSMSALRNNLAATGGLDSGRLRTGATDIETERLGKATDFFSSIPMLNQQAQASQMQGLLGLGTNFAGRAPINTRQSGSTSGFSTASGRSKGSASGTGRSSGTQTQQGPGFGSQIGMDLGGIAGGLFNDYLNKGGASNLGKLGSWFSGLLGRKS